MIAFKDLPLLMRKVTEYEQANNVTAIVEIADGATSVEWYAGDEDQEEQVKGPTAESLVDSPSAFKQKYIKAKTWADLDKVYQDLPVEQLTTLTCQGLHRP